MSSYKLGNFIAVFYYFQNDTPIAIKKPDRGVQLPSTRAKITEAVHCNPGTGPKSLLDMTTPDLLSATSAELPRNIRQVGKIFF